MADMHRCLMLRDARFRPTLTPGSRSWKTPKRLAAYFLESRLLSSLFYPRPHNYLNVSLKHPVTKPVTLHLRLTCGQYLSNAEHGEPLAIGSSGINGDHVVENRTPFDCWPPESKKRYARHREAAVMELEAMERPQGERYKRLCTTLRVRNRTDRCSNATITVIFVHH